MTAKERSRRIILSTGDQCGRDTPDENIQTMIDAAEVYGRYERRASAIQNWRI